METNNSCIKRITIFVLLLTVSCSIQPQTNSNPTATNPLPATITTHQPSSTLISEIKTSTGIPTSTTHPQTPSLTLSPTFTQALPSATLFPALPAAEAEKTILDLLQTNGNCKLPCWWGLTPGKTSAQDVKAFLERFRNTSYISFSDEKGGYIDLHALSNDLIVRPVLDYHINTNDDTLEMLSVQLNIERNLSEGGFEIAYGDPLNAQLLRLYTLPQILSTYGKPGEALIWGNRGMMQFNLLLVYPESGILVNYIAPLERVSEQYSECPSKAYPTFYFWPPEHKYSPAEVASLQQGEGIGQEWLANYLPIEEATSLTLEEFYTIFQDARNTACIETPVNLWPVP